MKTVHRKKLLEYFSNPLRVPADSTGNVPSIYFFNRQIFNRVSLLFLVLVPSVLFSGFARGAIVVSISTVTFLVILYFRTKKMAEGLSVKRTAPASAYEKGTITVNYEIENSSAFGATELMLVDHFSGSNSPLDMSIIDTPLYGGDTFKLTRTRVCDGGMGEHTHGPLQLRISDALGFFHFTVTETEPSTTEVLPLIQPIPDLPVEGSLNSTSYGIYDVQARGTSVNFLGLREYRTGDPLKQISWRLSLKHAKALVKEFEKVVNTQITLILDLDANYHAGDGGDSTWEWAKDIALSIAAQQVSLGNDLQVITQSEYISFGRGDEHVQYLALRLMGMQPVDSKERVNLISKYIEFIPRNSTVFYIGPGFTFDLSPTLKALPRLRMYDSQVFCVLLDGASFALGKLNGAVIHTTGSLWTKPKLKEALLFLLKAEVPVYLVQMQRRFAKALGRKVA
ncbi:MAG TPA: DUF58 domain-containing protein [Bdellovibrionales bacterium]|nr:DUF58 domain-containing protein [Bdellovibrionales bacterium]